MPTVPAAARMTLAARRGRMPVAGLPMAGLPITGLNRNNRNNASLPRAGD